jgi:hypothetical protein
MSGADRSVLDLYRLPHDYPTGTLREQSLAVLAVPQIPTHVMLDYIH